MLTALSISLIGVYLLLVLGIGVWAGKKESSQGFLIAERKAGMWQTTASIVALAGGLVLAGQATLAFSFGWAAMWIWVGFGLGLLVLSGFAEKINKLARKHNLLTISEILFTKFGVKSGVLSALVVFLGVLVILVAQFIVGGGLFAGLLGISSVTAILVMGIVTLTYLLLGGFQAILKTDVLQFVIFFFVSALLLFYLKGDFSIATEGASFLSLGWGGGLMLAVAPFAAIFGSPDLFQRIFAAKEGGVAKKSAWLSAGLFVILGAVFTVIGILAKTAFPEINPDDALFYGLFQLLPPALLGVAVVVLLAAIMSTIDTELFVLASSITKDFVGRGKKLSEKQTVKLIKWLMVVLMGVSMAAAIWMSDLIFLLFGVIGLFVILAPVIVGSFLWKLKANAVLLSLLGGVGVLVYLIVMGQFNPETTIWVLPGSILGLGLGQVIFRK